MLCVSFGVWKGSIGRHTPVLAAGLSLILLAGCMVGPNFQRPQPAAMPAQWAGPTPRTAPQPVTPAEEELARWWTVFADPTLTALIERALQSNLDLRVADARILQARAVKGIAAGGFWPAVDASGTYQRSRFGAGGSNETVAGTSDQYRAGFDAAWEADVFGGVRRSVEAADADLESAVQTRRDVLVTLTAEVAVNYVNLRAFQQQIAIAQNNLAAQEHSAAITRQRFEGGFASGLDVSNAEAEAATTASRIPLLEASARQSIYSLGVLLGMPPESSISELTPVASIPAAASLVPFGVPSDLLRRRPDIRRAEAQLHAATARIGVAVADLYPKFNISGSLGFQAADFSPWFNWANRFWSFGPSVSWRLFEGGRIRAGIELQKALQTEEGVVYQQTVLKSLQEVENALIALSKEQAHQEWLAKAVASNRKAVSLATTLYSGGLTDFLNVLQAQGALYATEDALMQSTRTLSTNLVALYKALGGGWTEPGAAPPINPNK